MSKITGLSYKFIKQHIALGEIYLCDKLVKDGQNDINIAKGKTRS